MEKQNIKLSESCLREIIKESVKKVINEERDIDDDSYFGGGLPDNYSNNKPITYTAEKDVNKVIKELFDPFINAIYRTFDRYDGNTSEVYSVLENIEKEVNSLITLIDVLPQLKSWDSSTINATAFVA